MDEKAIIARCKQGDTDAFKQLYDRYSQPLLRTAQRMLGNRHDAEDAVQTAFVRLFRSVARFEGRSAFSSYIFRILIHVCFDMLKKKKRMRPAPMDNMMVSAPQDPSGMMALSEAIDSLPPRMKACFTLFAIEELKQEEVAKILGLSLGGVKANIYHAKRKLRAGLCGEGGESS